jgi:uncharacterized phage protein (TIGR01671 family)
MRDIKFRGKRIGNGGWTYGNFYYWTRYKVDIPIIGKGVQNGSIYGFEVDPDTVGQFTGLTDNNGVEIYEGDILIVKIAGIPIQVYVDFNSSCGAFQIRYPQMRSSIGARETWISDFLHCYMNYMQVVGNIYDDKEFAKNKFKGNN